MNGRNRAFFPIVAISLLPLGALAAGPMAAKVKITPLASYQGADSLPKPTKILLHEFAVNPADIQVDKVQSHRPRHLITGDEKPDSLAAKAEKTYLNEIEKKLAQTGIPVERAEADAASPEGALIIDGSFVTLKQGSKAERVTVGLGTGKADVKTTVNVHLNTGGTPVLLTQFETTTSAAKNVGAGVPIAVGLNPAAVAAKSTVGDRRRNMNSYLSKSADAAANEIIQAMAKQGWVTTDSKGKIVK